MGESGRRYLRKQRKNVIDPKAVSRAASLLCDALSSLLMRDGNPGCDPRQATEGARGAAQGEGGGEERGIRSPAVCIGSIQARFMMYLLPMWATALVFLSLRQYHVLFELGCQRGLAHGCLHRRVYLVHPLSVARDSACGRRAAEQTHIRPSELLSFKRTS